MARQHHVTILWQSVRNWDFSREQRPEVAPKLSGADLKGAYLVAAVIGLSREQIQHVTLDPSTKLPAYLDF
jgi:hypothetical protein